jgi:hypothetical protein
MSFDKGYCRRERSEEESSLHFTRICSLVRDNDGV